jgi:hypothetical protein
MIGNFKNGGAKWDRSPVLVNDHDFLSEASIELLRTELQSDSPPIARLRHRYKRRPVSQGGSTEHR